jgi:hypothetical protein
MHARGNYEYSFRYDRKVAWKDERTGQRDKTSETTIVFTQNVTRIIEAKASENKEDDDEVIAENNETNEHERVSLELAPTFERMIKEMMNLPDN